MLTVDVATADPLEVHADSLVVGVFTGGIEGPGVEAVIDCLGLSGLPVTPQFRGDIGQHVVLASPGLAVATVLFVGLGRMVATDSERLRQAAIVAASCGSLSGRVVTTLALVHPSAEAMGAVAEGFHLGAHRDRRFLSGDGHDDPITDHVTILVPSAALEDGQRAVRRAAITARATIAARDLVNTPPNHKPPQALARDLMALTAGTCDADLHEQAALERAGFGGLLSVARGASNPACMLELRYEPDEPLGHVVLCGKGTTFDAGGLALRPTRAMEAAKAEMAGAGAIAAACSALGDLDVRVRVTALLGLVEAMPGGDAQRPDDVITTRGGTTVEITDADADTPLVLGDLLDLARTYEPDAIVDVTTGDAASVTALGRFCGAVMGSDQQLVDALRTAAASAGEPLWQLPLSDELDRRLTSPVADIVNRETKAGGDAIVTGLALRRFVKSTPWAHIDCTGPAFIPSDVAGGARRSGGTGYGVRTLLSWLEHRTAHPG